MVTDVLVEQGRQLAAELGDAAAFAELDVRDADNFDAGESSRFAAQPIPRAARPEEIADAGSFSPATNRASTPAPSSSSMAA